MISLVRRTRLPLHDEKSAQVALQAAFLADGIPHEREFSLSKADIVDFLIEGGIALEMKLKGSRSQILRQIERYAEHDQVQEIILLTGRCMHIPDEINGKRAVVVWMSGAWL